MVKCSNCGRKFSIYRDGKRLRNRTRCFKCSPFKPGGASLGGGKARTTVWYKRQKELFGVDPISLRRKARKQFILGLVGSKCQFCGYARCSRNLAFHHSEDKETQLSEREFQNALSVLLNELMKCVVICHNCHGEIHEGIIEQKEVDGKRKIFSAALSKLKNQEWSDVMDHFDSVRDKYNAELKRVLDGGERKQGSLHYGPQTIKCSKCGKGLIRSIRDRIRLRTRCSECAKPKTQWPSDKELAEIVRQKPVTNIARELGISDRAVKKHCVKRGIKTPGPGYWMKMRTSDVQRLT